MTTHIAKSLHALWNTSNGTIVYGITVRRDESKEQVEDRGYRREWDVNDITIMSQDLTTWLDITPDQLKELRLEIQAQDKVCPNLKNRIVSG